MLIIGLNKSVVGSGWFRFQILAGTAAGAAAGAPGPAPASAAAAAAAAAVAAASAVGVGMVHHGIAVRNPLLCAKAITWCENMTGGLCSHVEVD